MKKVILLICAALMFAAAAGAQEPSAAAQGVVQAPSVEMDYLPVILKMCDNASAARFEFDYRRAEAIIRQAIMVFESQAREFQERGRELKSELYYDLTRYLSLQDKPDEALDAFAQAIDHGWANHSFAKNDGDLDNLRRERRFRQMLLAIK